MSYRDDLTAAQARITALEQENTTLRAKLAKVPARRELLRSMMRDTDSPDEMTHQLDRLERIFTDHSRATAVTEEITTGLSKRLAHERELDEFRHETDLMKHETKRIGRWNYARTWALMVLCAALALSTVRFLLF